MARTMKKPLTKSEYSKLSKTAKAWLKKSCGCYTRSTKRKRKKY